MKDKYEAQIKTLTAENERLLKENSEYPQKVSDLENECKDWKTKYETKCKEIEKLLADLKK
jgi:predicted RNase H-like nuclease (RuvC/YqgF family)